MNICLGLMNHGDQEFLRRLRSDPHVAHWLFSRVKQISEEEQEAWYQRTMRDDSHLVWVARTELDTERIGYGQIYNIDNYHTSCEIGVVVAPEFQGQGVGKEIVLRLLAMCFEDVLAGMNSVVVKVLAHNHPALAMFRSCWFQWRGYLPEAIYRDGRHFDMVIMSMLRRDYDRYTGARSGAHGD